MLLSAVVALLTSIFLSMPPLLHCTIQTQTLSRSPMPEPAPTMSPGNRPRFTPIRQPNYTCASFNVPKPIGAARARLSQLGVVEADFIIGVNGEVESIVILRSGGPGQSQFVKESLLRLRFQPGTCDGVPVDVEATIKRSDH